MPKQQWLKVPCHSATSVIHAGQLGLDELRWAHCHSCLSASCARRLQPNHVISAPHGFGTSGWLDQASPQGVLRAAFQEGESRSSRVPFLLVKEHQKVSPNSRSGEIDSTSQWKELEGHIAEECEELTVDIFLKL